MQIEPELLAKVVIMLVNVLPRQIAKFMRKFSRNAHPFGDSHPMGYLSV